MSSISSLSSLSSGSYSHSVAFSSNNTISAISSLVTSTLESASNSSASSESYLSSTASSSSNSPIDTTSALSLLVTATLENATSSSIPSSLSLSPGFKIPQKKLRVKHSSSGIPTSSSSSTSSTSSTYDFTMRGVPFRVRKPGTGSSSLSSSTTTSNSSPKFTSAFRPMSSAINSPSSSSSSSSTSSISTQSTVEEDLSSLSVSSSTSSDINISDWIVRIAHSGKELAKFLLLPELSKEHLAAGINAYQKNHADKVTAQFLVECSSIITDQVQHSNFAGNARYAITNLRWPLNVKILEEICSFEEEFYADDYITEVLVNIFSNPSVVGFDLDCLHFYLFYGFPLHSWDDPTDSPTSKLKTLVPNQTTVDLYFHEYLEIESKDERIEEWLAKHNLQPSEEAPSKWILPFCMNIRTEE